MSSWAKPGVKCVLVNPNPLWKSCPLDGVTVPVMGIIYTVQEVLSLDWAVAIRLCEIHNDRLFELGVFAGAIIIGTPVFGVRRFRPLVRKSDDLALFAHHLDRVGEPA